MVYRFIDDNKNIFGLRWLCNKFGISPNCYYNYKKEAKQKYHERLAHIFDLIKYVYYNNNRVIGYRSMRIFIKRYGYEVSNTTMHKYMNKEMMDELTTKYINWYNYVRPHSHNNYLTPMEARYK